MELIQEGAFNSQPVLMQQPQSINHVMYQPNMMQPQPMLMGNITAHQPQPTNLESIAPVISNQLVKNMKLPAGQENIYKSIFEDTIMHTLPNQANTSAEQYSEQGMLSEVVQQKNDLINSAELNQFGNTQKWAKIAFANHNRKLPGQSSNIDEDYR